MDKLKYTAISQRTGEKGPFFQGRLRYKVRMMKQLLEKACVKFGHSNFVSKFWQNTDIWGQQDLQSRLHLFSVSSLLILTMVKVNRQLLLPFSCVHFKSKQMWNSISIYICDSMMIDTIMLILLSNNAKNFFLNLNI